MSSRATCYRRGGRASTFDSSERVVRRDMILTSESAFPGSELMNLKWGFWKEGKGREKERRQEVSSGGKEEGGRRRRRNEDELTGFEVRSLILQT